MKHNPFLALGKRHIKRMSQAQIIAEAKRRRYKLLYRGRSGVSVGGSSAKYGPDLWMNAANNRLWQLAATLATIEAATHDGRAYSEGCKP